MAWVAFFVFVLAVLAFIRLAPSEVADWHVKPDQAEPVGLYRDIGQFTGVYTVEDDGQARLAHLDRLARATLRTKLLAGSVEDGHLTYITRSLVMGFPDYTTASLHRTKTGETVLRIHARLRFGIDDMGVNEQRVRDWATIVLSD